MLVQPALAAANVLDVDLSKVRVFFPDATEGLENEVDFNRLAKAHTRDFTFTANRSQERLPVSVIIMLPEDAQTLDDLSTFLVQIVYRGTALSEMETQLQPAWMKRPIREGLAVPALEEYIKVNNSKLDSYCINNFHQAKSRFELLVDNADGSQSRVHGDGEPCFKYSRGAEDVRVTLKLPESTSTAVPSSAPFMICVVTPSGPSSSDSLAGDEGHSTLLDTRLNKKWLSKTLREGLILPALESMKMDGGADRIETIEIDGNGFVDGNSKASTYVSPYGNTVTVTIRLGAA